MSLIPTVVNGDIIVTRNACSMFGQRGINVRHWEASGSIGVALGLDTIVAHLDGLVHQKYKDVLSEHAQYVGMSAARFRSVNGPTVEFFSLGNPGAGGVLGLAMSPQSSLIATLLTIYPGQRGRGRMYIPFPGVNCTDEDTGLVREDFAVNITALVDWFATPVTVTDGVNSIVLTPVLWNKALPTDPVTPERFPTILTYRTRLYVATQRRRSLTRHADLAFGS